MLFSVAAMHSAVIHWHAFCFRDFRTWMDGGAAPAVRRFVVRVPPDRHQRRASRTDQTRWEKSNNEFACR
jgi:hypothetical protein